MMHASSSGPAFQNLTRAELKKKKKKYSTTKYMKRTHQLFDNVPQQMCSHCLNIHDWIRL